jgi:hypothetical protein
MISQILIQLLTFSITHATPISPRQAVTDAMSPPEAPPPGCLSSFSGIFGIAVINITASDNHYAVSKRQPVLPRANCTSNDSMPSTTRYCDCESEVAPTTTNPPPPPPPLTIAQVNQIADGQIQGGMHTVTVQPVNQIFDGQIQYQNERLTYAPAAYTPPSGPSNATANPSHTAPLSTATASSHPPSSSNSSSTGEDDDRFVNDIVSCRHNDSLQLHLSDSVLTDALGRTGYIASNYQFQFDAPPQSGSLYTSGWGVCANGSLSLGGQATFWQCLSGDFYNLYDRWWAGQCSEVVLRVVELVDCGEREGEGK